MKKLLTIMTVLFMTTLCFAQTKTVKLCENKIATADCEYDKIIDLDKGDTIYFVSIYYQNQEYKSITDIQGVYFTKQIDLDKFIKDLKSALIEMDSVKSNVSWKQKKYTINKYDFSSDLYIQNADGAYTTMNKKDVQQLIVWLEGIKIGSDEVKPFVYVKDVEKPKKGKSKN